MILGAYPCREPNSQVRLFSSPRVLVFHDATLREETKHFWTVWVLDDGPKSVEILVCGLEILHLRTWRDTAGKAFGIGLLCGMNLVMKWLW